MENLQTIIISLGSIISACTVIAVAIKKWLIQPVMTRIEEVDMHQCKSYLVEFLADVEQGIDKNDIQMKRAYEVYDHYIKIGGNSYIKHTWEELILKGGK